MSSSERSSEIVVGIGEAATALTLLVSGYRPSGEVECFRQSKSAAPRRASVRDRFKSCARRRERNSRGVYICKVGELSKAIASSKYISMWPRLSVMRRIKRSKIACGGGGASWHTKLLFLESEQSFSCREGDYVRVNIFL